MISWNEYKKYSRGYFGEEFFDFVLFRPIAYILVKLTWKLPLTPNMFSFLGLISALWASYQMALGTSLSLKLGALGIIIFSVLDCCDGLLARMKGNSSPFGELIDMIVDLVASIGFFSCAYIGFHKLEGASSYHMLIPLAGILIFLHATIYNYYKKLYQFYQNGNPDGREREIEKYRRELFKIPAHEIHKRFLIRFYLIFCRLQSNPEKKLRFERSNYLAFNKQILPLWGLIAGSTHLLILSVSLFLNNISYYLYFAFMIANTWMLFIFTIQSGLNKNLEVRS